MSFSPDVMKTAVELSEVIRLQNQALEKVREFRDARPYAIAPNLLRMIEENLKENIQMLYKELNQVNTPAAERKRHVCRQCHHVFASSLPGGLCDECRSKPAGQPAAYGVWPVTPESESITVSDVTPYSIEDKLKIEPGASSAEFDAEDGPQVAVEKIVDENETR
ncbi:MAG: hypothetical protein ACR2IE_18640 [Candidatus Sumerlaeaceae bacterium]